MNKDLVPLNGRHVLPLVNTPHALRRLNNSALGQLADEIREVIIDTVSHTGGHLASNLGVVELTLALHYAFHTPEDKLIWDVGHQVYCHKIITGRHAGFRKGLRQYNGISGFPKKAESEFDHYDTGHGGTSLSYAIGMAEAIRCSGRRNWVIPIIGDGSMTAGVAFEALSQGGHLKQENLLVIINDNDMSISPNVGTLAQYISRRMVGPRAASVRRYTKQLLAAIPRAGDDLIRLVQKLERSLKDFIQPGLLFEELGFQYLGPFDGHDLNTLIPVFRNVQNIPGPLLLHVLTKKGQGYKPAELEPERFHGASPFNRDTGAFIVKNTPPSYTNVFGDALLDLGERDDRVVAITAAMTLGTGLDRFAERFPDRFYDVGMAEQHAVAFAGGLANAGLRPVVAIYSTFMQRAFDQVFQEICLQDVPVVMVLDRAGIVGADGPTHHGVFDLSFLRTLPNIGIIAPRDENELRRAVLSSLTFDKPVVIRYPRGNGIGVSLDKQPPLLEWGTGECLQEGTDVTVAAVGPLAMDAVHVAEKLCDAGISVEVIDARFVKPLDSALLLKSIRKTGALITLEENALAGGFGSAVLEMLAGYGAIPAVVELMAIPDRWVSMGSQAELRSDLGLSAAELERRIRLIVDRQSADAVRTAQSQPAEKHDSSRQISD
ncbi:1-deoxy-D-xylulose-5-phosphate synthase [bacterium]|nr:1-deoxy-D-xylulose-5-phosphate synthase [candidate division CSSED10-310 bacterium]